MEKQTCVICGSCFLGAPDTDAQKWLGHIRLSRCRSDDSVATLTGVGYLDPPGFTVPEDASSRIIPGESGPGLERHRETACSPTVVFHESCWNMLFEYMSLKTNTRHEENDVAQCLYDLIFDLPPGKNSSVFIGQNGFTTPCRGNTALPIIFEYAGADPDMLLLTHVEKELAETETDLLILEGSPNSFTSLPTKLVHHIITFLDSSSVCNLRLSSKVIASVTGPKDLPQAFWASRFATDDELDFFPLDCLSAAARNDWRQVYFDVRHSLLDCSKTGHIHNRQRIWSCVKRLSLPLKMMLDQLLDVRRFKPLPIGFGLPGYLGTEKTQGLAKRRELRIKAEQYLALDPEFFETGDLRMSISTMIIKSTTYICGIRISRGDDKVSGDEMSRVGFVLPDTETHLCIQRSSHLTAIRVTASIGGIIGLSFQQTDIEGKFSWQSADHRDKLLDFAGVVTLKPAMNERILGIIVGFDTYKAISIQLLEDPISFASPSASRMSVRMQPRWLWYPVEPDSRNLIVPPQMAQHSIPGQPTLALNMNFGGSDGSWLPRLIHVSVFTSAGTNAPKGLGFYYVDGSCKRYLFQSDISDSISTRLCYEVGFPLNGSGGERINGLKLERLGGEVILKITTNFHRVLKSNQADQEKESNELGLTNKRKIEIREVPDGQTIIAILASVEPSESHGNIESLGISCIQDRGAPSTTTTRPSLSARQFCLQRGHLSG
ncbi:hypothetical protein FPSE_05552 [Fusarium pseudograminearum CS3096]|uniref:F-box domain-containing protein n=1 Tax=Fusarium pseudograminearum (strain CS3096) TaxID=1028729 RepID=K3W0J4_FUSPC|nr:hypothetical protein FPSE_05552 [Fusarium pseudograminearum CS3096]EKJ74255.1 hypothetical protein FPSE_05552 [Fusarium pseudograminearum CS3096]